MNIYEQLKLKSQETGCAGFGVTSAAPFADVADTIDLRRTAGHAGKLRFTYKQPEIASDVRRSFPWAQSLVVASWSYLPEAGTPGKQARGFGRIARFATEDHYRGLRQALATLQKTLLDAGWRAEVLIGLSTVPPPFAPGSRGGGRARWFSIPDMARGCCSAPL